MKNYTNQRNLKLTCKGKSQIKNNPKQVEQGFVFKEKLKKPKGTEYNKDYFTFNTSNEHDPMGLCLELTRSFPLERVDNPISARDLLSQNTTKNPSLLSTNNRSSTNNKTFFLFLLAILAFPARSAHALDNLHATALNPDLDLNPLQSEGFEQRVQISAYQNHTFFNSAFSSDLPHAKKNQLSQTESSLTYFGLAVEDRTSDITGCKKKKFGTSAGKICNIGHVEHYFKVVKTDHSKKDKFTNSILGLYNLSFIKNNLCITAPNAGLIYEENGKYYSFTSDKEVVASHYVASKKATNFTTISELAIKTHRTFNLNQQKPSLSSNSEESSLKSIMRNNVISKIGELGLAKFAVAGTFFQDLISNDGNWGYDDQGLVIIDVDNSPSSFEEYFTEAVRVPRNIGFDFSVNTINMMIELYKEMLTKSPPIFHASFDMSDEFYQNLVILYIKACDLAILQIKVQLPSLKSDEPSHPINEILTHSLIEIMNNSRRDGLFSKYQRYQPDDGEKLRVNKP